MADDTIRRSEARRPRDSGGGRVMTADKIEPADIRTVVVGLEQASGSLAMALHLGTISEAEAGIEFAAGALAELPKDLLTADADLRKCVASAGEDIVRLRVDLNHARVPWPLDMYMCCDTLRGKLDRICAGIHFLIPAQAPKQQRKPSMRSVIARAEKATGKSVTSITTPDGVTLTFGEPATGEKQGNELDEWIAKHAH